MKRQNIGIHIIKEIHSSPADILFILKGKLRVKKIIPVMFLLIVCMTACGKNVSSKVQTDDKGDGTNSQTTWYYQEEKSVYEKPGPEIEPEGEYGILRDFYETTDGEIYFLYQEDRTENEKSNYFPNGPRKNVEYLHTIIRYSPDDKTFSTLALQTDSGIFLSAIWVSEDGTIILFDTHRAYVYPMNEMVCTADFPSDPRGGVLFQDTTHLICQPTMDSGYMVFDIRTGEKTEDYISREFLHEGVMSGGSFLTRDQEKELLVTGNGIYEKEGEEWILKVPSERTSMGLNSFWADGVWKAGEEYFIADQDILYHYFLMERNPEDMVELRLFSAAESGLLKNAVLEYQTANPNVNITYEFAGSQAPNSNQELDTLLKRVNTEIISDQAADIYVLDELPWEGYVDKGLFMNIDQVVVPLLGTGKYFDRVLNGYREETGTFVVPLFFEADYIVCRKEMTPYVESLADLAGYLKEHPDTSGLVPYNNRGNVKDFFLPMLYHFYGSELYEDGKVTKEKLETFFGEAKILYDRLLNDEEAETSSYLMDYRNYDVIIEEELWQLLGCGKGNALLAILGRASIYTFPQIYHYDDFEVIPTGQFHPEMLMGVHSQTEHPEEACDFLQFLASYAGIYSEKSRAIPGIPVTRQTVDVWLRTYEEACRKHWGFDEGFYYRTMFGESYPTYLPVEEDSMRITELLDQASTPRGYADPLTDSVYAILVQGIDGYFEGEKSLDSTVDELYSKISLKQSEEE